MSLSGHDVSAGAGPPEHQSGQNHQKRRSRCFPGQVSALSQVGKVLVDLFLPREQLSGLLAAAQPETGGGRGPEVGGDQGDAPENRGPITPGPDPSHGGTQEHEGAEQSAAQDALLLAPGHSPSRRSTLSRRCRAGAQVQEPEGEHEGEHLAKNRV